MLKLTRRDVREISTGVLFLLPNILGFLAFTTIPLAISLFMAFTDWNLEMHNMFQNQELRSVGFANFAKLFSDPDFPTFLGNTLFLMLGIPFGIAGSLFAALLLNNDFRCSRMKRVYGAVVLTVVLIVACGMLILAGAGSTAMTLLICGIVGTVLVLGSVGGQTVYRTLFYFPSFTADVATYILWKKLYSPENGPINNVLQPVLDRITPVAASISPTTAHVLSAVFLVVMGLVYSYALFRVIVSWKNGETGTLSYMIALVVLSIPMLCCQLWCSLPWGGALGLSLVTLAAIFTLLMFLTGREYKCAYDYGMSNAIVLDGIVMVGLFICLGISNVLLAMPGMAGSPDGLTAPKWLSDYYWAKPSLMIMGFWAAIGSNNMLLYLAGLSGVSQELYEAADIDGASPFQRFWNVTWPQLSNVTFFILIMSIMGGLQGGFETARTMTRGGPAGSTTTLAYYIYSEGFESGRLGYASAVAWTLFVMVFCVTLFNWKFGNKYTND